jgi:hypothetical protein
MVKVESQQLPGAALFRTQASAVVNVTQPESKYQTLLVIMQLPKVPDMYIDLGSDFRNQCDLLANSRFQMYT